MKLSSEFSVYRIFCLRMTNKTRTHLANASDIHKLDPEIAELILQSKCLPANWRRFVSILYDKDILKRFPASSNRMSFWNIMVKLIIHAVPCMEIHCALNALTGKMIFFLYDPSQVKVTKASFSDISSHAHDTFLCTKFRFISFDVLWSSMPRSIQLATFMLRLI